MGEFTPGSPWLIALVIKKPIYIEVAMISFFHSLLKATITNQISSDLVKHLDCALHDMKKP